MAFHFLSRIFGTLTNLHKIKWKLMQQNLKNCVQSGKDGKIAATASQVKQIIMRMLL